MTEEKKLLLPTNDYVFKKIFSENLPALADLIQTVLGLPEGELEDIALVDKELTGDTPEEKKCFLDIRVRTHNGHTIDVEMQVAYHKGIWKRLQYYISKLYTDQLKSGMKYSSLKHVVTIMLCNFELLPHIHSPLSRYRFKEIYRNDEMSESMEIAVVEIPKYKYSSGKLKDWLRFFSSKTKEEFMEAAAANPQIDSVLGTLTAVSSNLNERLAAEQREKDRIIALERWDDGVEEGIGRGIRLAILNLLHGGMEPAMIAKYMHMTEEQIIAISQTV